MRPALTEQFGYKNRMQVPTIDKVVLNMGIGEGVADRKKVESAAADLALIAGQKAVITKSRKSIATYKLRDGQAIGCKVTLRKARMYEFIDRLVNIALPRVRDFRGLNPKSFDGRGNFAIGIKEHIVFPEIDYDKVDRCLGHGHHRLHQRAQRRRGARAARRIQFPVPAVRRREAVLKRGNKEQSNGEDEFDREEQPAQEDGQEVFRPPRANSKAIAHDKKLPMEERFAATLKLAELPRNSASTASATAARSPAGRAPITASSSMSPHRAARSRLQGPDPRPREVELVRRDAWHERSDRRHDRPASATRRCATSRRCRRPARSCARACSTCSRAKATSAAIASVEHADGRNELEIELKYFDGAPVIREIERVSKPGRRVYASVQALPRINNGLGVAILSTPKGVMADHDARDANVGGEILCTVF